MLKIMRLYVPNYIKKRTIAELLRINSEAFRCEAPDIKELSYKESLSSYALFTKEQAENYINKRLPPDELKRNLSLNAYYYGRRLYKRYKIKSLKDAVRVLQMIYKHMGIDFECNEQGEFSMKRCFFSQYYNAASCELLTKLEEGLAAGLTGGAVINFQQRLTENGSCCKGNFKQWKEIRK